ncbi:MAG: radical SAM protein [candidate division WOR-3 bacterium]
MSSFRVVLVFPPVWETTAPYLSVPVLSAFLKSHGISVQQVDANIIFWDRFLSAEELGEIYDNCRADYRRLSRIARSRTEDEFRLLLLSRITRMSKEEFSEFAIRGSIDRDTISYLIKKYSRHARQIQKQAVHGLAVWPNLAYHDSYYWELSMSYAAQDSAMLIETVENRDENPFTEFTEQEILPLIIGANPQIVGVSITALNQVVPAFTIAKMVKESLPRTCTVAGGAWVTQLKDKIARIPDLFRYFDIFVAGPGEKPLLEICHRIQNSQPPRLDGIDNLMYADDNGEIVRTGLSPGVSLNLLPTPEFEGLPLKKYDEQGYLPLLGARGCYWARCRFCSYPAIETRYEERAVELVVADIINLKGKMDVEYIGFADPIISPKRIKKLAQLLLDKNTGITWGGYARLEPGFTNSLFRQAASAGLVILFWGLESGSQRVQRLIGKNISIHLAMDILKNAHQAGIHNRLMLMYRFPGESENDFAQTVDFVERVLPFIGSFTITPYQPEYNTPLAEALIEQGLAAPLGDLGIGLLYLPKGNGLWRAQLRRLEKLSNVIDLELSHFYNQGVV